MPIQLGKQKMKSLNELGVFVPKILLPNKMVDQKKWPVIACDQYTSQHSYWENLKQFVGNSFSTLNLIFPEIYLEKSDFKERVHNVQQTMSKYLSEKIFQETNGFILVERTLPSGSKRIGLMIAVDLEKYDYSPDSRSLIRPTEGTIVSRIPVRVEIRRNAPLELPHILLLVDDEKKSVIEPIYAAANTKKFEVLYDTELPLKSGHLKGYLVPKDYEDHLTRNLNNLLERDSGNSPLLFAVGDGNHSLATAKAYWNEIKDHSPKDHPARFALVELINLHDQSLLVEPIHRVLFGIDKKEFFDELDSFFNQRGSRTTLLSASATPQNNSNLFHFVYGNDSIFVQVEPALPGLEARIMQEFIDLFLKKYPKSSVDYIHGEETVKELAAQAKSNIGLILPEVIKSQLLPYIEKNGPLPRKFFSLGEADEKRFYYECRLIK
jgi:uncharacterized protein (DUF1015 family)